MKPVVVCSVNDESGQRCVDFLHLSDGQYQFRECRRDPEDSFGWRLLSEPSDRRYCSPTEAKLAAVSLVGWLTEDYFA
ncbi:MAG: hypothetical protein WBO29_03730 [Albidovulum sp.]